MSRHFPLISLGLVVGLVTATQLVGAAPPGSTGLSDAPDPGRGIRIALLGGVAGFGDETPHYFGGAEAAALGERFGAAGVSQWGWGRRHSSLLLGIGPALRLLRTDPIDLMIWVGPGIYGEFVGSGARRQLRVAQGGLSAHLPVGAKLLLAANLSGWTGSFEAEDFVEPLDARGVRLAFGLGWRF